MSKGWSRGGGTAYLAQILDNLLQIVEPTIWHRLCTPLFIQCVVELVLEVRGHVEAIELLRDARHTGRNHSELHRLLDWCTERSL